METTSEQAKPETKFCPYRIFYAPNTIGDPPQFAPCLQEKCAMWRVEKKHDDWDGKYTYPGYCGLAGKP